MHTCSLYGQRMQLAGLLLAFVCGVASATAADLSSSGKTGAAMSFVLTSAAFPANGMIPAHYTCDGQNVSPPLVWGTLPAGTKSLVLIVDDPDAPDPAAPKRIWVHWVLYNIPPDASGLPEGIAPKSLPPGTLQGMNDWQRTGYGGPCPPIGVHRYFHKLFALDNVLPDMQEPAKAVLEKAMQGHILGRAELIGRYQRRH